MGNVLRVIRRDALRLLKAPAALVVVVALIFLPSLYTWYNVIGFWNPYDNTSNLRVDVVNQDAGASHELVGDICVGDMIEEQLRENDQLDWQFVDYDTAMDNLSSGESYAVFVVPEDFSACLLTLTTGEFIQPNLQYYVNEKAGPVAPKITDAGATELDETINSMFVSTVSDVAVEALDAALADVDAAAAASRSSALASMDEVLATVGRVGDALSAATDDVGEAQEKVEGAESSLDEVRSDMATASAALTSVSELAGIMQDELADFSSSLMPALGASTTLVSSASAQANAAAAEAIGALETAQARVSALLDPGRSSLVESQEAADNMRVLADALPDGAAGKEALLDAAEELDAENARASELLESLESLDAQIGSALQDANDASGALDDAVQGVISGTAASVDVLFGSVVPAASESLTQLATTSSRLAASLSTQDVLIDQAELVIDQLSSTLGTTQEALSQTDGLLGELERGIQDVRTDVEALGSASVIAQLAGEGGLDAAKIAEFMGSPTEVRTEQLYPLNAYGSAMAPLFMNLTFWIGAFMLMVVMKQEVDREGVENLTVPQSYLARFLFFAVLVVLQAVVCCAGVVVIGVQVVNLPALFLAASVASLTYLSIIYTLSVTLQHIGKGLCVVLVFMQIPGATGLYPIEMTSPFFQAISPFFPFTYGIGAMREAICGFYGSQYAFDLGMLCVFLVAFMAIGLLVRPLMANVNHMVAGQVRESGLFTGENVEVPARPYRVTQLMRALADKEDYRTQIVARYERFLRWYPRFIRGSIVAGVGVPVVLIVLFALTPAEKVVLLTVWLVFLVATLVFLVVVESLRSSFERQLDLGDMSDQRLLALFASRNVMGTTAGEPAPAGAAVAATGAVPGAEDASGVSPSAAGTPAESVADAAAGSPAEDAADAAADAAEEGGRHA